MTPNLVIWVQTRLGLGHLARALALGGALAESGCRVSVAHGGPPAPDLPVHPDVELVQLPVAHAPNLESSEILDGHGAPVTEAWRTARIAALKDAILARKPDVFITETFPLGRWLFGFEVTPVLEWLHALPDRPLIVASVRDILTRPEKTAKAQAMIALARARYDMVLCHGDPAIMTLPESFPEMAGLETIVRYSGYIASQPMPQNRPRTGVLITAGGGAGGGALFDAAIASKRMWTRDIGPWTLIAGPKYSQPEREALRAAAPPGLTVEGGVSNLAERFARAALVIGQAGYNTVCDALSQGARLVVVPYATGKETEQTLRAEKFSKMGLLTVVPPAEVNARTVTEAMARALSADAPAMRPDFDGGRGSARRLWHALGEHRR